MEILLQVVLILINAFFAATELAVVSLNSTKLRKLEEDGNKTASKLLKMVEEPSGFLSTIQVAITLAGYLGSAFAAENFSGDLANWIFYGLGFQSLSLSALNTVSIVIITIILSYFTLVFGELVPKRIAMQKSYEVAKMACGVIRGMAFILRPVIWLLSKSVNGVLRLLRLKVEAEEESVTEDEIRMMVDLGGEKGAIDEDEQEWIQNVFDFGDISVREAMTPRSDVDALPIDSTDQEILEMIRESGHSRLPVYEESVDTILGILNARDFLLDRNSGKNTPLKNLLRSAHFVPETIKADNLFKEMQKEKIHIAIVVDEYGGTEGIITMEDLLESIVGNMQDEYDQEEEEYQKLSDTIFVLDGSMSVDDVEELLGMNIGPEEDYDTLSGMITDLLDCIPAKDEHPSVQVGNVKFTVLATDERRIAKLRAEILPVPEQTDEE